MTMDNGQTTSEPFEVPPGALSVTLEVGSTSAVIGWVADPEDLPELLMDVARELLTGRAARDQERRDRAARN